MEVQRFARVWDCGPVLVPRDVMCPSGCLVTVKVTLRGRGSHGLLGRRQY